MNTENKSLGILKDGNEVFVGDEIINPSNFAIWKVLGVGRHSRVLSGQVIEMSVGTRWVGDMSDRLITNWFKLHKRATKTVPFSQGVGIMVDGMPMYCASDWVIATSPSAPVVTRNCLCQSLFMNGHNHSCHMYLAPAPTINIWGIPQPVDNSQLIEIIKNSDDISRGKRNLLNRQNVIGTLPDIDCDVDFQLGKNWGV